MSSVKVCEKIIKKTNQKEIANQVQAMLSHFETYNFITNSGQNKLDFDFNAESLKQIIQNEWLFTNTILCDHPAFCFNSLNTENLLKSAFNRIKSMVSTVPFSLVEIATNFNMINEKKKSNLKNEVELIKNQFKWADKTLLRNYTFCLPQNAVEVFHKQQRERKIWWRKFSAFPGRFHTTEVCCNKENKIQFVEIKADFSWGVETVELIKFLPDDMLTDHNFFEMKNQKQKFLPQLVICETSLEKATLTYLCDSFEKYNEDSERQLLRFSKKLAPYKVAFAASGGGVADTVQNLKDLVMLLAKKIKKCGIPVLVLPDMCSTSIERQILRNDALGIPYTILLNEKTLKDGIISIRSRDTTLKEQSHVSLVVSYIEKIMKSC